MRMNTDTNACVNIERCPERAQIFVLTMMIPWTSPAEALRQFSRHELATMPLEFSKIGFSRLSFGSWLCVVENCGRAMRTTHHETVHCGGSKILGPERCDGRSSFSQFPLLRTARGRNGQPSIFGRDDGHPNGINGTELWKSPGDSSSHVDAFSTWWFSWCSRRGIYSQSGEADCHSPSTAFQSL